MIEQIIKQFLFEQRRYKAVVKAAPSSTIAKSKEAGAVFAFFVRFKFKPGAGTIPTEAQLLKELASIISKNSTVGETSKYANGRYVYVISNRLKESNNRLLFNVWIYDRLYWESLTSPAESDSTTSDIVLTGKVPYPIGNSPMVQQSSVGKYTPKDLFTTDQLKGQSRIQSINTTVVSQETEDLGTNVQPPEPQPAAISDTDELPVDSEENDISVSDTDAIKPDAEKIKYPYTKSTGQIIYTTGPTDDWVYTHANNIWYGMKKLDFEQSLTTNSNPKIAEIKNKTAIDTLNKLANITPAIKFATLPVDIYTKSGNAFIKTGKKISTQPSKPQYRFDSEGKYTSLVGASKDPAKSYWVLTSTLK